MATDQTTDFRSFLKLFLPHPIVAKLAKHHAFCQRQRKFHPRLLRLESHPRRELCHHPLARLSCQKLPALCGHRLLSGRVLQPL